MIRTPILKPLLYTLAIGLCLAGGVVLRFTDLEADPPLQFSSSAGCTFDGQSNAHGARSYVRFGTLRPDEWDTFLYSPTYTLLQIPWFKVFGTGLCSTNAFAAMWSTIAMLLAVLLFRHQGPLVMLAASLFFAFEFLGIQLGRVGLVENLVIVCMLASLCCLEIRRHAATGMFLAGLFAMAAVITKAIVPYFPLAAMTGVLFRAWQDGRREGRITRCLLARTGLYLLGILCAFLPWLLFYRLPNAEAIRDFGGEWVKSTMPHSMGQALAGMTTTSLFFNIGKIQNLWILALPALAAIAALLVLRPRRLTASGVALAAWLVGGSLFVALLRANPLRYAFPLLPAVYGIIVYGFALLMGSRSLTIREGWKNAAVDLPAILACTLFIRYFVHYRPGFSLMPLLPGALPRIWELMLACLLLAALGWGLFRTVFWLARRSTQPLPFWLKAVVALTVAVHFAEQNKEALRQRSRQRQHTIVQVSRMLGEKYPGMIIAGTSACTAVIENDGKAIRVTRPEWCNWDNPFERFGITHTFISDYAGEASRYFRLYPEAMTNAVYRESVNVCGFTYKIYETPAYRRP